MCSEPGFVFEFVSCLVESVGVESRGQGGVFCFRFVVGALCHARVRVCCRAAVVSLCSCTVLVLFCFACVTAGLLLVVALLASLRAPEPRL